MFLTTYVNINDVIDDVANVDVIDDVDDIINV